MPRGAQALWIARCGCFGPTACRVKGGVCSPATRVVDSHAFPKGCGATRMPAERLSEHIELCIVASCGCFAEGQQDRKAGMKVQLRKLDGSWDAGYALNKHTLSSNFIGYNEFGRAMFDTTRSEPGEALFQLKYRSDWSQVEPLAAQIKASLLPMFGKVDLIVPMPASTTRDRQPVDEIAKELSKIANIPVFDNIIAKAPAPQGSPQLKNLTTRQEKDEALNGRFSINPVITDEVCWNALLLDDLFDTGATMDAVTKTLKTYKKIGNVYAAAITW